jgi:DNA-binding response OmpR family regulator
MGKIVYNIERRIVYDKKNSFRPKKKLTKKQGKILELFRDNKTHSYEEIMEKVYELKVDKVTESERIKIRTIISRLRKVIKNYKEIEILKTHKYKSLYGSFKMKGVVWLE